MGLAELSTVVVLTGIIVVFAVLAILTFATMGYGMLIKRFFDSRVLQKNTTVKSLECSELMLNADLNVTDEEIDSKTVAIIAGAVYSLDTNSKSKYVIRGISPLDTENTISPWKLSGMLKNTHLFKF